MKLLIILALITLSFQIQVKKNVNNQVLYTYYTAPLTTYSLYDCAYYPYYPSLCSPYYFYSPAYYTYDVYYYRKSKGEEPKKELSLEEAKKELAQLKKLLFGDENKDTSDLKEMKSYDNKWLVEQLKLSRALEIEDILGLVNKSKSSRREEEEASTSASSSNSAKKSRREEEEASTSSSNSAKKSRKRYMRS